MDVLVTAKEVYNRVIKCLYLFVAQSQSRLFAIFIVT